MNRILEPVTSDGRAGFDEYGQFWVYSREDAYGHTKGSIYADLRGQTCPICTKQWSADSDELSNQFYYESAKTYLHHTCFVRYLALQERTKFVTMLVVAGFNVSGFDEIPDQYNGAWGTPWYRVEIDSPSKPVLVCGPRRRVFSITVERLTRRQVAELKTAFSDEKSTMEEHTDSFLIHAWDDEKALSYLTTINRIINATAIPVRDTSSITLTLPGRAAASLHAENAAAPSE